MESTQKVSSAPCSNREHEGNEPGALANLIDADHPFYCGPHSMVAPHLPVGSPEREALFKELRKTFDADWKAAEESVKREQKVKKGDLYFIRCRDSVKIGRTSNIVQRLRNMQVNNHLEVDCLLLLRGQGHTEKKWHERFKAHRVRGEWFRWCPQIEMAIDLERNLNMERCAQPSTPNEDGL